MKNINNSIGRVVNFELIGYEFNSHLMLFKKCGIKLIGKLSVFQTDKAGSKPAFRKKGLSMNNLSLKKIKDVINTIY